MLMLQYRFNTTRDRYRGTGAGNSEESRFWVCAGLSAPS